MTRADIANLRGYCSPVYPGSRRIAHVASSVQLYVGVYVARIDIGATARCGDREPRNSRFNKGRNEEPERGSLRLALVVPLLPVKRGVPFLSRRAIIDPAKLHYNEGNEETFQQEPWSQKCRVHCSYVRFVRNANANVCSFAKESEHISYEVGRTSQMVTIASHCLWTRVARCFALID